MDSDIKQSLDRVERWIEAHDYKGYEAFDGLSSYLFPLTFRNLRLSQILQQSIRRMPVNLRPLLGVKPQESTKGRGFLAWGYLRRYMTSNDQIYMDKLMMCLDWLDKSRSPLYGQHSWGNEFIYASRGGYIEKHESTIVWTGLIGQVFLEVFELFRKPRHQEVIGSIAEWMMGLPRYPDGAGLCLSYTMKPSPRERAIHNSNMIGAAFLAGATKVTGKREYLDVARRAMEYSCNKQLSNGAWYYGEDKMYRWVDAFHTGYNLDSLKRYGQYSGDQRFEDNLRRGYRFFRQTFVNPSGRVNYYDTKARPIDIQCASQAIDTLIMFNDIDATAVDTACQIARWYIHNMQGLDGHFYFRRYPLGIINRTPMIHWGQATMHKALANIVFHLGRGGLCGVLGKIRF